MKGAVEIAVRRVALIFVVFSTFSAILVLQSESVAQKKPRLKPSPSPQAQVQPVASPSPIPSPAISLPQIAPRAEESVQKLREMNDRLTLDPTLRSTEQTRRSQEDLIGEKKRELDELIAITPIHTELQDIEQEWVAQREMYAALLKTLTERAKAVEEDIRFLDRQQAEWEGALNQIQSPEAIEAVFERIRDVLNEIRTTRSRANGLLGSLLASQDTVSKQNQVVLDALKKISKARARLQRSLFDQDSPPLWKETSQIPSDRPLDHMVRLSFNRNLVRTREFLQARRYSVLGLLFFFLAATAVTLTIHYRNPRWVEEHPDLATSIHLLNRPVSLSLLLVLMVILPMMTVLPVQIRTLVMLLFLSPVLRLLTPLIRPVFRPFLYVIVVFGMAAWVWETFVTWPGLKRWGLIVLSLAAIAGIVWLTRRARCQFQLSDRKARRVIPVIRLSLALILFSILANVFGYVGLSRVLRSGTTLSAYSAIVLYAAYLVTAYFLSALFQTRKLSTMSAAGLLGETMASWTLRLMSWVAFYFWASITLHLFMIREPVLGAISFALATPIKLRATSFTFGDVLTFILVLLAGIGVAGIIRVVLREGVLARLKLKHGIPYAISTITYYFLLLVVCMLALASAGLELSRFAILTSAFGLGAGFGLQNVISNFVSGIILLFERPVRIGDLLEIDRTSGEVIRMGMRSSSIRTPQGAVVIVPNSNLISNQVVNWTLTEQKRRRELQIKVAYGADPQQVSELLVEGAASHPDVMDEPPPSVRFLGFGDNSLDFELQFWVPQIGLRQDVSSEVAMKIVAELRKAGIRIPAPRRELYITGIDTSLKELLASGEPNQRVCPPNAPDAPSDLAAPGTNENATWARTQD